MRHRIELHIRNAAFSVAGLTRRLRLSPNQILMILAVLVGGLTALGALGFRWIIETCNEVFLVSGLEAFDSIGAGRYLLPLVPAVGGLLAGLVIHFVSTEAKGHGVPEVMASVALRGGVIRPQVAVGKSVASGICIGSGGSAGREGPIVQIGATLGSTIGQLFHMSSDRLRILVGCGAAAGISAIFNAPIAGVLFALEIIIGDFAIHTFSPVIISSVVASVISRSALGDHPAFAVPPYQLVSAWELPVYVLLGLVCALAAVGFVWTLYRSEDVFDRWTMPPWAKPAFGGLLLGVLAIAFPQILADGYSTISMALHGDLVLWLLGMLVVAKIAATSLTLGSGNSGGIFAPSLFIGAALGGAVGTVFHEVFPFATGHPGAYALVGMGAVVAGAIHAPITGFLIIFEMTADYRIVLPLMLATATATVVSYHLKKESIYTEKLVRRGIRLTTGRDAGILSEVRAHELMHPPRHTVAPSDTLDKLLKRVKRTGEPAFPIVTDEGDFTGTVSFNELRQCFAQPGMENLVIVDDLANHHPLVAHPDDTLGEVFRKFGLQDSDILPVVDPLARPTLVGVIHKGDVLRAYNARLVSRTTISDTN
jgi:CIC family chloride channel protein